MTLTLSFPPSVNHYWRRVGNRTLISREGRQYRAIVLAEVMEQGRPTLGTQSVHLAVELTPPDKRKRDLDNYDGKALLDALQFANVIHDDHQVRARTSKWTDPAKPGRALVTITPLGDT